jgi:putative ATP-dependent endonuclease of the OLD family
MFIQQALIKNYRCLVDADVVFNERMNVIVGQNECGKSTLLEAINLALTGQVNGRSILMELHPYLFNHEVVDTYVKTLKARRRAAPPYIEIELYLHDDPALAQFEGDQQ